ncbi:MAG: hypothetical protein WC962_10245 [Phycisphaerae bacterium]|jgi:uncharacterized repeat protein (TIGR01451 family)
MKKIAYKIIPILFLLTLAGCYSCQSWNNMWGTGPVDQSVAHKFFLDKQCKPLQPAPPAKPAEKPKPQPQKVEPKTTSCGPSSVSRAYPCDDCGVVKISKMMPSEVARGSTFAYDIIVKNVSDMIVTDVVVTENLGADFKYVSSTPSAQANGSTLIWKMDKLEPGEEKTIKVNGSAEAEECVKSCATVTYLMPACANVKVVQPALRLTKSAPTEVLICDPIPVKITVTNTGTGVARDVKVVDNLPQGLTTKDGRSSVTLDAGTLAAGQSKSFEMDLKASKPGTYTNKATATAAGNLQSEATTQTVVRQPILAITKTGPEQRYLGRDVTYDITLSNKGNAPAQSTVLEDQLPAGAKFVSATGGGTQTGSKVTWNIGTLAAGASRSVSVTVSPQGQGTIRNVASATATCAEDVTASASTKISGIAAVLLEVIDLEDPIEIGSNETYVITVTNQGSIADTNIRIACVLEEEQTYVSSTGPTTGRLEGNRVIFGPLATLAPKAEAVWRVTVKANAAGDVRFGVSMQTDQIVRPVEETESTNQY